MKLEREFGGYGRSMVRVYGSFQANGSSAPTLVRDGHSGLLTAKSGTGTGTPGVVRASAGTFTVTVWTARGCPEANKPVRVPCDVEQASATPTNFCKASYVAGSWTLAADHLTATFTIITHDGSGVKDPDSGSRVSFEFLAPAIAGAADPA